ncbi:MAG: D-alanyl-D-alanine carboxypeptidase [Pseudomonadota bacterium]
MRAFAGALTALAVLLTASIAAEPASANPKYAAFVYDVNKGKVLFSRNADRSRFPASLTKMMTLYMVFDAIDDGKITLNTRMKVSRQASRAVPSKLYLKAGSTIRVRDAILALVTKSANDVAVVIAEHLGGSEAKFARQMTRKARRLGMRSTTFKNASGLPNSGQRTTARDMARLGLLLHKNHPQSFKYFNTKAFRYGGKTYRNHNRLLSQVKGVNGIKTGYIRASGFNLVTNVETGGKHVVAVVMGGRTGRSRDAHMRSLIQRHLPKASRKRSRVKQDPLLVAEVVDPPAPIPNPRTAPVEYALATIPKKDPSVPFPIASPARAPIEASPVVVAASVTGSTSPASNPATEPAQQQTEQGSGEEIRPKIVKVSKIIVTAYGEEKMLKPQNDGTLKALPVHRALNAKVASQSQADDDLKPEGWKIQISASPSREHAEKLLKEASKRAAAVLNDRHPYMEPVQIGEGTLYRVRFAGFESKKDARAACAFMKKKRYRCIALN